MNSFKRVRAFQTELEFGNVVFLGGKTGVPGEKPLVAKERTNNKLDPHMASTPGHIGGRGGLSPLRRPFSPNDLAFIVSSSLKPTGNTYVFKFLKHFCSFLIENFSYPFIKLVFTIENSY